MFLRLCVICSNSGLVDIVLGYHVRLLLVVSDYIITSTAPFSLGAGYSVDSLSEPACTRPYTAPHSLYTRITTSKQQLKLHRVNLVVSYRC